MVNGFIRGTTATFQFNLPYAHIDLEWARITFWQTGNGGPCLQRPLPIVKVLEECERCEDDMIIFVTLTEEETLRFSDRLHAKVQFRAQAKDGTTFANELALVRVYPVAPDGTTGDDMIPTSDWEWVVVDGGSPVATKWDWIVLDGGTI